MALPAFEVVSIKPSAPIDIAAIRAGKAHIGTRIDAARVDIGTASLYRLICTAYRLKPYQVTGPEWLKNSMFDIEAKIPEGGKVEKSSTGNDSDIAHGKVWLKDSPRDYGAAGLCVGGGKRRDRR